ncbi:crossover junction endodeoxyribonuclease RuvC [Methanoculleus bourgensis]|uniref:crossover junction endodeoxyribonuclease RuvC n=1 Tax=Methanoculleus bourgensis TaxID=83986 RepID=UPI003B94B8E9
MRSAPPGEGIVIGIDPGVARTGYGVLRRCDPYPTPLAFGCIETPSNHRPSRRLLEIYEKISLLIDEYTPECLAMEQLFFSRNVTSAMHVSEARGVILLAAEQRGIPVTEYTPNQVKLAVTGSGRADKHQVQEMMRRLLRLQELPRPDDAADGLAIALCHINMVR